MAIQERARAGMRGKALAVAGALLLCAGLAQAAPVPGQGTWETTLKARDIDGNAVAQDSADAVFFYDTLLNVTWLRQANITGLNWADAKAWADGLTVGGFTDWRLPEVKPVNGTSFNYDLEADGTTDHSYNIGAPGTLYAGSTASELAHLFHVTLGNRGRYDANWDDQSDWGLTNTGEFLGLWSDVYWSSTEYAYNCRWLWITDRCGFVFGLGWGVQRAEPEWATISAIALRSGDVLRAAAVPEPSALALFLSSFGALLWVCRRAA